jgi:hypothetical protein
VQARYEFARARRQERALTDARPPCRPQHRRGLAGNDRLDRIEITLQVLRVCPLRQRRGSVARSGYRFSITKPSWPLRRATISTFATVVSDLLCVAVLGFNPITRIFRSPSHPNTKRQRSSDEFA